MIGMGYGIRGNGNDGRGVGERGGNSAVYAANVCFKVEATGTDGFRFAGQVCSWVIVILQRCDCNTAY